MDLPNTGGSCSSEASSPYCSRCRARVAGPDACSARDALRRYALVDGVTALWVGAFAGAGWLVLSGVLGLAVGISTFIYPGITAVALFYLIAAWAIARGVLEIMAAIKLRKEISGEWALILGGIFSIAFGMLLITYPVAGVLALVGLIGAYSLMFGVAMIFLAFRLRGLPRKLELHPGKA